MFLLTTMTGAEPETRWILVLWITAFSEMIWTGGYKELPRVFAVSKKSFDTAIRYLVSEGYLGRTRKQNFSITNAKKLEHFEYYVTEYSKDYWRKSLPNAYSTPNLWYKQMFPLLLDINEQTQIAKKMTVTMRLVMLFLYSKADIAGYVVLPGAELIKKELGMTELEFAKTIKKLVGIQQLKFASEKLKHDLLREGLHPICVIARQPYMWRIINWGIVAERDSPIPMLLDDLFLSSFLKNKYLLNEIRKKYAVPKTMFDDMALTFKNKKLHATLQHLCLRTLFALVPYSENEQSLGQDEKQTTDNVATGTVLRARIVEKFFEGVVGEQDLRQALISGQIEGKDLNANSRREHLKFWIFNQIFAELENTILELSKQFAFLTRNYTGPVHLIGWLHRQKMTAQHPEGGPNRPHKVLVGRVMEVLIVEKQSCYDVVLVDQELLAADKDLD